MFRIIAEQLPKDSNVMTSYWTNYLCCAIPHFFRADYSSGDLFRAGELFALAWSIFDLFCLAFRQMISEEILVEIWVKARKAKRHRN